MKLLIAISIYFAAVACLQRCALKSFEQIKTLGQGTYGIVRLAKQDGKMYAIKEPKKGGSTDLLRELRIYETLDHPHILKPVCGSRNLRSPFMVMNYYQEGDLSTFLFSGASLARIASQLIGALYYFHAAGYIHFDLKPENILFDGKNAIIADMGLAQSKNNIIHICGTVYTAAPEVRRCMVNKRACNRSIINESVDWYSLGATLYVLALEDYKLSKCIHLDIENHKYPPSFTAPFKQLLNMLLEKDPSKRTFRSERSIKKLMDLPFFKGIDWTSILYKPDDNFAEVDLKESKKMLLKNEIQEACARIEPAKIEPNRIILDEPYPELLPVGDGNFFAELHTDDPMEIDDEENPFFINFSLLEEKAKNDPQVKALMEQLKKLQKELQSKLTRNNRVK